MAFTTEAGEYCPLWRGWMSLPCWSTIQTQVVPGGFVVFLQDSSVVTAFVVVNGNRYEVGFNGFSYEGWLNTSLPKFLQVAQPGISWNSRKMGNFFEQPVLALHPDSVTNEWYPIPAVCFEQTDVYTRIKRAMYGGSSSPTYFFQAKVLSMVSMSFRMKSSTGAVESGLTVALKYSDALKNGGRIGERKLYRRSHRPDTSKSMPLPRLFLRWWILRRWLWCCVCR